MPFEQSVKQKMLKFRLFKTVKATTCISDLYEIGNTLGKGSFGEVKVCTHKLTGVKHAMKIVSKVEISKHPMTVRLMENELKVLQNTEHPHIIRVIELLQDDLNCYIISELATGGELFDHIVKVKLMSERQAANVIK